MTKMSPVGRVSAVGDRPGHRRTNASTQHERPNYPHSQVVKDHHHVLQPNDRIGYGNAPPRRRLHAPESGKMVGWRTTRRRDAVVLRHAASQGQPSENSYESAPLAAWSGCSTPILRPHPLLYRPSCLVSVSTAPSSPPSCPPWPLPSSALPLVSPPVASRPSS